MMEQTVQLSLPSWSTDAVLESLERQLRQFHFQKSVQAGEVGGVEVEVWRRNSETVTFSVKEGETFTELTLTAQGLNGAALAGVAVAEVAQELLRQAAKSLPDPQRTSLGRIAKDLANLASEWSF